jgi:hypothetical protein
MPQIAIIAVMAAMAAGSAAYSAKQQNDAAEVAADSAKNAASADYMATEDAATQTNQAAQSEALKLKRQALVERGRIVSAQSETGFFGNSPLREMLNARLKEKEALGTTRYNQENALLHGGRESAKIFADASGRVNQARAGFNSPWATGLQITTAAVGGGLAGYQLSQGATKPKKAGATA